MGELMQIKEKGIYDLADLKMRIMYLSSRKEEQEMEIKRQVKELYYSIHPSYFLQNVASGSVQRNDWTPGIKKIGLALAKDFLIGRFFKSHRSVRGFLAAALVNKVTTQLINDADLMETGMEKIKKILKRVRRKAK
jgi:hypothetical protein